MVLKLTSLLGMVVLIATAWSCSVDRRRFPWRTVACGLGLQVAFGWLILRTGPGRLLFGFGQGVFERLIACANEGALLVFGPLADATFLAAEWGPGRSYLFVVTVTTMIVVVSAVSGLLYHYGLLQRVVRGMGWVMQRLMRTSGSESLVAAANIFMGQAEAPLVVRPYLPRMTRSELMALMTAGMATIAGGVMAAYVSFGISAGHLLTASVMSAPAALMIAKIMVPETEVSETAGGASAQTGRETTNGIDALCRGAAEGMILSLNVMATLIAFVAVVALANYLLAWPQRQFGVESPVTLQTALGWCNAPFAWLMGIPARDCLAVGQVLGERIVLNEFIAYTDLARLSESLEPRSVTLAVYALCGFANFGSIAIQIGGIGSLAPQRRGELARLGLRAMVAGLLACYVTAAVVGLLV